MFTVEQRDRVRDRLIELAKPDGEVAAAALVGSSATGATDPWSDIDMALSIRGDLAAAMERWTRTLEGEFGAIRHWDLRSGAAVYRVFLLSDGPEVDLSFVPEAEFGARGPHWRTLFGESVTLPAAAPPRVDDLAGLAWHHLLHARSCIERGRLWQAEYWISGVRDQVLALASLRWGHETSYAKGAHQLPASVTVPLEAALVRSLDRGELRRRAAGSIVSAVARTRHGKLKRGRRPRRLIRKWSSPRSVVSGVSPVKQIDQEDPERA